MKVDKFTLAKENKCLILNTIRNNKTINRAEIAKYTKLSIPTAMKITDELVEQGVVRYCGRHQSSGGKRPNMYEFAGEDFFAIGIDIAPTNHKVLVMDLMGNIIAKVQNSGVELHTDANRVVENIALLVKQVIEKSELNPEKILGVGVGMPGILDISKGTVLFSPNFHWENVELLNLLNKELMKHTSVSWNLYMENSNRAMALGEKYFSQEANCDFFVCVNLGYGIGSAIVENGKLYVGTSGTSGEIGHITVERDGPMCTCGNNGCLEAVASGRVIAQQAKAIANIGIITEIFNFDGVNVQTVEAKHVFKAAANGDKAALDITRRASEYIGIGLASYINLLDPEKIILAGGMAKEEILVENIKKVTNKRRMRFAGRNVKIEVSKLGEFLTAIGAAAIFLDKLLTEGSIGEK